MEENVKQVLEIILHERMKTKASLEMLRFFQSHNTSEFKKQVDFLRCNFTSKTDVEQMEEFIDKMVKEEMEEREHAFNDIKLQANLMLNFAIQDISRKLGSITIP